MLKWRFGSWNLVKTLPREGCWSLKVVPVLRVPHGSQGDPCILHHSFQIPDYQGIWIQSPSPLQGSLLGTMEKYSSWSQKRIGFPPSPLRAIWPWGSHSDPLSLTFFISKKRLQLHHRVSVTNQYGQATHAPGWRLSPWHLLHKDEVPHLLFHHCVLALRALVHFGASGRTLDILLSPGHLRKHNSNEASGISDRVHVFIIIHLGFEKQTSPTHSFGCYSSASWGWFFSKDRESLCHWMFKNVCLLPFCFPWHLFLSELVGEILFLSLQLSSPSLPSSFAFLLSTFFRESCDIM